MELVAQWIMDPSDESRFRTMQQALYQQPQTAAVHLGLAVGWAAAPYAPNDPTPFPVGRVAKAVNSAVLTSLAGADPSRRLLVLEQFLNGAEPIYYHDTA